ncbi:SDR family NAD(P)-dependent oxidoreductase [Egicoccus sp. AB-alg6-2]|uniref:SDR family NAD(P)-dependent oxidoreductase n=1 Tax=Egicoccus sp. AB-alg6-2 TaxID=3242692 RepID=UPI00359DD72B
MSEERLAGTRAVVTGAHGGFGQAVTVALAQRGASVLAIDIDPDIVSWGEQLTSTYGGRVVGRCCDLAATTEHELSQLIGPEPLNVLVNALGIFGRGRLENLDRETWAGVIATNLTAAVATTAICLPALQAAAWGRVLNLGSSFAARGRPESTAYSASKAGLMAFTRSLAEELRNTSVTVNCIAPGATDTPLFRATYPEGAHRGGEGVPRDLAAPEDIIAPLLFLCSHGANHITGTTLWMQGP